MKKKHVICFLLQAEERQEWRSLVSESNGDEGGDRVPRGGPGPADSCHWNEDPGPVRQRTRPGVRRRVPPRLLETGLREVAPMAEPTRQAGKDHKATALLIIGTFHHLRHSRMLNVKC